MSDLWPIIMWVGIVLLFGVVAALSHKWGWRDGEYWGYQRGFADGSKAKPEIVKAREQMLGQPSKPDK
jgi:hypothetical protein